MVALSVPLSIPMGQASGNTKPPALAVGRSPSQSQPYKGAFAPRVIREGNVLRLTHLTLSFLGRPALALTIFRSVAKEHDIQTPPMTFGRGSKRTTCGASFTLTGCPTTLKTHG